MLPANQAQDPNDPSKIDQEPYDPCTGVREDARALAYLADALSVSYNHGITREMQALIDKYLT